ALAVASRAGATSSRWLGWLVPPGEFGVVDLLDPVIHQSEDGWCDRAVRQRDRPGDQVVVDGRVSREPPALAIAIGAGGVGAIGVLPQQVANFVHQHAASES